MHWQICDPSGADIADGKKGRYWVTELAWAYLSLVEPTPSGPKTTEFGAFNSVDHAKNFAENHDKEVAQ